MNSIDLIAPKDEERLAAEIRAGDEKAFAAVVHDYLPHVLRAARAAGLDPRDVEDVSQSTFTTFMEVAHRFEGRSRVRTFLFGILYKKIAEARRKSSKARRFEAIDGIVEGRFDTHGSWQLPPRPIDLELQDAEVRDAIEGCLEGVATKQRMAFVFREVEGLDTAEICKILEVSRTNLGVLLYRAKNRLRECLEGKGFGANSC
jgi:RNA polymerase sigma-70 factor (ECF subfamily)